MDERNAETTASVATIDTRQEKPTAKAGLDERQKREPTLDPQAQIEELKRRLEESEKLTKRLRTENNELKRLRTENNELRTENKEYQKKLPTIKDTADMGMLSPPPNESDSSAHTKTGHRPAEVKQTLVLPDELGGADKFWSYRQEPPKFANSINSEVSSSFVVQTVLTFIMGPLSEHLGFQIMDVLDIHACISLLDTIPDLSLLGPNKIIGSSVEIKKDPRTSDTQVNQIYGTETQVQGEVYEQLYLVGCNNLGSGSVGLVSTAEHYALVSLDDDMSYEIEKIKTFFSGGEKKTKSTPDRMQTAIFKRSKHLSGEKKKNFKVAKQPRPVVVPDDFVVRDTEGKILKDEKGNTMLSKYGRVAAIASEQSASYSHYSSKVLSMRSDPNGTLNLLAVFVILTLRNLMRYSENANRKNFMDMTEFTTRFVSEPNTFSLTAVTLSRPIDFLCPTKSCEGKGFYAIRQLGFGSHGVCCLSFNKNGYACVLKFIHKKIIKNRGSQNVASEAKEEAAMWKKIYGKKYGITAKVLEVNDRCIIVMPYLQIPSTGEDKLALCENEKSSKLYRGLKQFCDAGYTHNELQWHHVGEMPSNTPDSDNPCLLCDLGNISKHNMTEKQKEQWVNEAFTTLKNRLNREQENCLQTPKK